MKYIFECNSDSDLLQLRDFLNKKFQVIPSNFDKTQSIVMLGMSVRTIMALFGSDIKTVDHLTEFTASELIRIPNFGRKAFNEVIEALRVNGLSLLVTP
jgi:DNA-directed RNA polymerase alpha subunit